MDKTMKRYLEEFIGLSYTRLEKGEKTQKGAYKKTDLYEQIMEELADVANYAFLEYMRIRNLKKMKTKATRMKKSKKRHTKKRKKKSRKRR